MDLNFDASTVLLKMKYKGGKSRKTGVEYPDVDELRPLSLLGQDLPQLFPYTGYDEVIPPPERSRSRIETQAAVLLQTVNSAKPWEEEWVSFWRDHFSIYGYDNNVGAFLPHWELEVIRKNCWGNFRDFLEVQASHPCMLYYLNNRTSKAGSANENFARELFELHTLGKKSYLNSLYSDWKKVPGALQGKPEGYIDQDVYEAARAFTGWTVEDGSSVGGKQNLPATGKFIYMESRHDNYQKRVLATEFSPYGGAMVDGRKVLDLCSKHSGTAKHLAEKLVRRFISDEPPMSMIQSTTNVWVENSKHPQQLKKVFDHLVKVSNSVAVESRQKALRPIPLVAKFTQLTRLPFSIGNGGILGAVDSAGVPVYGWPSPDGPPDTIPWVISSGNLRQRISLIQGLAENAWGNGEFDPFINATSSKSVQQMMAAWENIFFNKPRPELSNSIFSTMSINPQDTISDPKKARKLVGLLACSPSFQTASFLHAADRNLKG